MVLECDVGLIDVDVGVVWLVCGDCGEVGGGIWVGGDYGFGLMVCGVGLKKCVVVGSVLVFV